MGKKLDIEKNDAPNYWKISNYTNKHYVDIMSTKSDLSESEYNSVSKIRMSYLNAEMSEISDVLNYFAVRNSDIYKCQYYIISQKFMSDWTHVRKHWWESEISDLLNWCVRNFEGGLI